MRKSLLAVALAAAVTAIVAASGHTTTPERNASPQSLLPASTRSST